MAETIQIGQVLKGISRNPSDDEIQLSKITCFEPSLAISFNVKSKPISMPVHSAAPKKPKFIALTLRAASHIGKTANPIPN